MAKLGAAQENCRVKDFILIKAKEEYDSHRFAGFKEPERERIANHFSTNFYLDMLDRLVEVIV